MARTGSADLAEDLFQDLWLRLERGTGGPIANPKAYLLRIANNLVIDYRRSQLRAQARDAAWLGSADPALQAGDEPADPAPGADEDLIARQDRALLRQAIADLPRGARQALTLHRIDGLPQAEVATAMGISRSGVEKHMAVAMAHLRKRFVAGRDAIDCGHSPAATSGLQHPSDLQDQFEHGHD